MIKKSIVVHYRVEQRRQGKLLELLSKPDFRSYGANCAEAIANSNKSGIYEILIPSYSSQPFKVECDVETHGGGWTILLRREDGSVDFYRDWNVYKKGFGDLDGEFFLGLDKIHALTAERSQQLLVILEDFEGAVKYESYEKFAIGDEDESYILHTVGKPEGTAGDSLTGHRDMKFTTMDRHNDPNPDNCAQRYMGAWWYRKCHSRYKSVETVSSNYSIYDFPHLSVI